MQALLAPENNGRVSVAGDLFFATVSGLLQQSACLFQDQTSLTFDFAQVKRCDSSGVALLLEWYRQARLKKKQIRFINMTPQMQKIIELCELGEILCDGN